MTTPSLFDLLDARPDAPAPPPPQRVLSRHAAMYRDWRDAMLHVARSEQAHGCLEAARVYIRQALRDHRRMMAEIRGAGA
jgi:hypothetical protein